jgi:type I restriction enzyme R subunit
MSRRICFELYEALRALRPDWHNPDDARGCIKIVMTGSPSDPLEWQAHIRSKHGREALAKRFKKPDDPFKKFLIQSRSFAALLEQSIQRYQNRAIETAQVIEELIALAREMREANRRGQHLKLTEDEVAFYDALEINDSAVKVLGDENLRFIARELVKTIRENVSIDWTAKESVRARLRVMVKRILRKHGYPPDKQEKATQTVLQQAELLCADWAG